MGGWVGGGGWRPVTCTALGLNEQEVSWLFNNTQGQEGRRQSVQEALPALLLLTTTADTHTHTHTHTPSDPKHSFTHE